MQESAEFFTRERYGSALREDGTPHLDHIRGVVTRVKGLGVSDPQVIAAAWLQGIINDSKATFDEIDQRFGSSVSVMVMALSLDKSVPRKEAERRYDRQVSEAPAVVQVLKLCDISTSFKELKNSTLSRNRKNKKMRKEVHYLLLMRHGLSGSKSQFPGIESILGGINETISAHGQRPVSF